MRPSTSMAAQLRPISPRPPRNVTVTGLAISPPYEQVAPAERRGSIARARSSVPAGAGPSGSRHSPTGRPRTRRAALVAWENTHASELEQAKLGRGAWR